MNKFKNCKGITLVALIITIIILLILAGVAIAQLQNNGLFGKTQAAKEKWDNSQADEDEKIAKYTNEIDSYLTGNRENEYVVGETLYENVAGLQAEGNFNLSKDIDLYNRFIILFEIKGCNKSVMVYGKGTSVLLDGSVLEAAKFHRSISRVLVLPSTGKVANLQTEYGTQNGGYYVPANGAQQLILHKIIGYKN